ncbi:hypothetical protein FNF28_00243 [Cafeteria roenbergensis]|uniref:FAD dependent oxidoreductase domain-containing protein n=1 Tax=Cafeteria roenbergensis TaxID=33653 RepID=A0A5A8E8E0_CAFRO|nr:hypothetical protein FNF28_00243 [Cafeteria roenbergensis]
MAGRSALLATSAQRIKSYDAAIIGCGVVGVSVARALSLTGLSTVILEAGDGPFSGASGNNSGIVCTGFDAPLRSLERRSLVAGRAELLSLGNRVLEPHAFDPRGSLVADFGETDSTHPLAAPAQEEAEAAYALQRIVDECRDVEDVHSRVLGRTEALLREPSLAANLRSAALVAGEVVFDPVMLYMALLRDAITAGAELRVGCRVVEAAAPVPVTRDQSDTEVACGGWGEVDRAAAVTRARSASRALAGIGVPWALEAGRLVEGRNLPEEEQAGGGASEGVFRSLEAGDYWLLQLRQRQVGKSAPLRGAGGGAATRGSAKARTQPEGEPRPDEAAERRVTGDEADAAAEEAASVRAGMVFNCTGNGADMVDVLMRAALGEHYGGIAPASALVSGRDRPASAVTDGTWRVRPRRGQYAVLGPLPPPGTPATGPVVAADAAPASGSAGSASSASGATHGPAHPGGSAGMGLTVAAASAAVPRSPLQPLPSDATKGVYLFAPAMPPGANAALVVGPTAQDVPADDPVAQWSESLEGASERPAPALDRGVHERWSASLSPTEEALLSTLAEHRLRNFEVAREAPKGVKGAATVPAGGNIGSNVWGLSATGLPRPAPTALATWDTDDSDCDTSSLADLQEAPDAEPLQPSDAQRREVRAKLPEASELDTAALLAGGAFDFGNPKAAEALAVEASLLGEEHVLSGVSSALAAVAEAIESASLDAADMALDECYGSGGMAASAMPTAMSAGFEIPGDLDAGRAFQDRRLRSSPLVEEFCLSLMQEIRRHGLDAEQVLRLPAHEWPVTGSVTVAGQTIPVMHALTRIVWAVRGGLLRAVPLGSDWETAYGEHPARR